MIMDRSACAFIYMLLAQIYTSFSFVFYACLLLDFGSHFLQFNSSALMKSDSHKGKNEKENFIVQYYYDNYIFFCTLVVCAELCSGALVIYDRSETLKLYVLYQLITAFLSLNLAVKMFINCHQWKGAVGRL